MLLFSTGIFSNKEADVRFWRLKVASDAMRALVSAPALILLDWPWMFSVRCKTIISSRVEDNDLEEHNIIFYLHKYQHGTKFFNYSCSNVSSSTSPSKIDNIWEAQWHFEKARGHSNVVDDFLVDLEGVDQHRWTRQELACSFYANGPRHQIRKTTLIEWENLLANLFWN